MCLSSNTAPNAEMVHNRTQFQVTHKQHMFRKNANRFVFGQKCGVLEEKSRSGVCASTASFSGVSNFEIRISELGGESQKVITTCLILEGACALCSKSLSGHTRETLRDLLVPFHENSSIKTNGRFRHTYQHEHAARTGTDARCL